MGRGESQQTDVPAPRYRDSLSWQTGDAGRVYRKELRRLGFDQDKRDPYTVRLYHEGENGFTVEVRHTKATFSGDPLTWLKGLQNKDELYEQLYEQQQLNYTDGAKVRLEQQISRLNLPLRAVVTTDQLGRPQADFEVTDPSVGLGEVPEGDSSPAGNLAELLVLLPDGAGLDEYRLAVRYYNAGYDEGRVAGYRDS